MNHLQLFCFYFFSLTAIVGALVVVTNRRPAYAILALTLTMLALSALFVLLEAYFVAVIQILIYAGAILVLFLFVVMLLGIESNESEENKPKRPIRMQTLIQTALAVFLFVEFSLIIIEAKYLPQTMIHIPGTVESIGEALFTRYLLPFELVSGILLIGIFGVVSLAYRGYEKS